MKEIVQNAIVAGIFYPESSIELADVVDGYLRRHDICRDIGIKVQGSIKAILVPHAGYVYSGEVAASGFRVLQQSLLKQSLNRSGGERKCCNVFVLASNHVRHTPYFKISVLDVDYCKTPLGKVRVSSLAHKLRANDLFTYVPQAHESHVIEVELPFLQRVFDEMNFEIIPIITGDVENSEIECAANVINTYVNDDSLIVVSSDLSHYHSYDEAVSLDTDALEAVVNLDSARLIANGHVCGLPAALILMHIARMRGWKACLLDYKNSGDTAGSKNEPVVGYGAVAFY